MTKLKGFNGMRAFACLAVLVHHLVQRLDSNNSIVQGLHAGEIGVTIFFVLSGALLSYPFCYAYLRNQALPSLCSYALKRAARIIPAFYLVLLLSFIINQALTPQDYAWARFAAALTFTAPYHYISFFPTDINAPLWSVGLEVSCYALLPLLLWPLLRHKAKSSLRILAYVVALIVITQFAHFLIIKLFMTDPTGKGWRYGIIGGAKQWLPYWNVASFMGQFLCGCLAAAIIAKLELRQYRAHWQCDALFIGILLISGYLSLYVLIPGAANPVTAQAYLAPLLSLLFAAALVVSHFSKVASRALDNRLFNHIATISFGIYLWHYLVMEVIHLMWVDNYVYAGISDVELWFELSLIVCAVSSLLAAFSYYLMERPIMQWAQQRCKQSNNKQCR
ncbi:acyltransferase [Agarivorans sp. 1_MG-2023]|uniref:acyltransferase family protein n=1 Tax=Agarivorans sp. 1_MG-2023 TaxID=3062634 RepID=UPI0026E1FCBE|nr:acyltransferase [Agarivorans sp. 1_MG-2023]MDO6765243.1 acyltransferase [Agarivorans sp. 1_MG-2023]